MIFLILLFWPFALLYFYVKWCISNNAKNLDKPLNKRPWLWTTVALLLVFLIASIFAPRNAASTEPLPSSSPSAVIAMESPAPSATPTPSPTPTPTATPTPTPSPTPTPTPEPTSTPTPAPEPAAEESATGAAGGAAAQTEDHGTMVWIAGSGNGTKYHSYAGCSNMKNPVEISLADAEARGYEPCKKCY